MFILLLPEVLSYYMCQEDWSGEGFGKHEVIDFLNKNRFELSSDDFCPIYCEEHLEAYVLDFANRMKLYNQKKDM